VQQSLASVQDVAAERLRLERTWAVPRGLIGWLSAADHKTIGRRFIATAFGFFVLGGILAVLMRIQLAQPENTFVDPDLYNQLFSLHGTTMMFLFAVPIMEAMALYLVPLMIGTREIAFPRLAAFNYWVLLFGGAMIYIALFLNIGPDAGWFSYVPLAGPEYSPGKRSDFWAQMVTFTELSALGIAVQLIVTILKQRAPGMSPNRMPLLVWAILVTSVMTVFAMPAVMLSSSFLIMDRLIGTHFFNPAEGGDALLWQHLFWFFGHPEVYIIFLPGLGFVASIIPTFARRPVFGYTAIDRLSLLRAVGPSHVHDRAAAARRELLYGRQHPDRAPERHSDLLLDRHAVGRPAAVRDAALVRARLLFHLRARRPDRGHAGIRAARCPGPRHLLRRGALPLRPDRRRRISAVRGVLLLVP
jgi:cytochrome c oxidase subunit 1